MSIAGSQLETIPLEVFDVILEHVECSSFPSLARTCCTLYGRVTPRLYRSVYLHYCEKISCTGLFDDHFRQREIRLPRIQDEGKFCRTIKNSPKLKTLTRELILEFSRPRSTVDSIISEYLKEPNLKSFHLRPTTWPLEQAVAAVVTSLDVKGSVLNGYDENFNPENFASAFLLPNIQNLRIDGSSRCWVPDVTKFPAHDPHRSVSNVTHLVLNQSPVNDPYLGGLLSWPKKLRSLTLQRFSFDMPCILEFVTPKGLVNALESQLEYLESLVVVDADYESLKVQWVMDLSQFKELKFIKLPLDFLVSIKPDGEYLHLSRRLPRSVESLQLECRPPKVSETGSLFSDGDSYNVDDDEEVIEDWIDILIRKITKELIGVASNQPLRHQQLQSVEIIFERWESCEDPVSQFESCIIPCTSEFAKVGVLFQVSRTFEQY